MISSISLNPETDAEAGKALVVGLSFKNIGIMPLDGINAKVSIPELGVSSTKFVEQIKNNNKLSEIREEFVLMILDNTQTGSYTVRGEIFSQFCGESEVNELPVFILGKSEQIKQIVNDKLVINIPILKQAIKNDGSEVIYQLKLTNEGPDSNAYTILLDGVNWANLRLPESNAFVIKPKESKTINIFASTETSELGEHVFFVTVKSDDRVLQQIPFRGNIIPVRVTGLLDTLRDILAVLSIVLIVSLGMIGLFFGIRRVTGNGKKEISEEIPDETEGEAYY